MSVSAISDNDIGDGLLTRVNSRRIDEFLPLRPTVLCVLQALADNQCHGYALMKAIEAVSDGAVRMGPGTLYGRLQRVERGGLVEELEDRPENDDPRRRYYGLTELGHAVLQAESRRLQRLLGLEQGKAAAAP